MKSWSGMTESLSYLKSADHTLDDVLAKNLPWPFTVIAATLLFSGCAIGDFTSYSGQQQNWPTQPGSFVSTNYVIPAYVHSWPDRPYVVLGYLDATTAPIRRRGVVAFAARRAKELGADAIIVMQQGQEYAGSISSGSAYTSGFLYNRGFTATTTGTGFSAPLFLGKAEVLAIKWKGYGIAGVGGLFSGHNGVRLNGSLRFSNQVLGDFGGGLEYRFTPHIGVFSEATWNVVDGPKNNFLQVNFGARFAF